MRAKELTTQQRIMILEDVLRKLKSGNTFGGLCAKINDSAYELFEIFDKANKIIPTFTLKNAKRITDVIAGATEDGYWWYALNNYDFKNRIKMVKWMIKQEKELLK